MTFYTQLPDRNTALDAYGADLIECEAMRSPWHWYHELVERFTEPPDYVATMQEYRRKLLADFCPGADHRYWWRGFFADLRVFSAEWGSYIVFGAVGLAVVSVVWLYAFRRYQRRQREKKLWAKLHS